MIRGVIWGVWDMMIILAWTDVWPGNNHVDPWEANCLQLFYQLGWDFTEFELQDNCVLIQHGCWQRHVKLKLSQWGLWLPETNFFSGTFYIVIWPTARSAQIHNLIFTPPHTVRISWYKHDTNTTQTRYKLINLWHILLFDKTLVFSLFVLCRKKSKTQILQLPLWRLPAVTGSCVYMSF